MYIYIYYIYNISDPIYIYIYGMFSLRIPFTNFFTNTFNKPLLLRTHVRKPSGAPAAPPSPRYPRAADGADGADVFAVKESVNMFVKESPQITDPCVNIGRLIKPQV